MRFNIGDKVRLKDPLFGRDNKEFVIVSRDFEQMNFTMYSETWSKDEVGHGGGCKRAIGANTGDPFGHWNVSKHEIELISAIEQPNFSIGDSVIYRGESGFEIVHQDDIDSFIVFSPEWQQKGRGHDGIRNNHYRGNGCIHGHHFTHIKNLKLANNEIHRTDSERCSGGITSKIHSKPIQIASGCRPTGSRTTSCRIGIKVGNGVVSNNRIQPH